MQTRPRLPSDRGGRGRGKAVVYEDGTVVATADDAGGVPHIADIEAASRPEQHSVAAIAIRPDGSCVVYEYHGDDRWLAARLHEHQPELHLEQRPPGFLTTKSTPS